MVVLGDHDHYLLRDDPVPLRGAGRPTGCRLPLGTGEHFRGLRPGAHHRGGCWGVPIGSLVDRRGARLPHELRLGSGRALALFGLARMECPCGSSTCSGRVAWGWRWP